MMLDTCFLIDLLRGDEAAIAQLERIERPAISAITLFELFSGLARSDRPQRGLIEQVLAGQRIVPLDEPLARAAGTLHGQLARKGTMLDPLDVMIGVAALDEDLLTRNVKDFRRIPGLQVHSY